MSLGTRSDPMKNYKVSTICDMVYTENDNGSIEILKNRWF